MERLKDKADLFAADACEGVLAHCGHLVVVDHYLARRRSVEPGDQPEQCRFTASRCPGDRDELAVRYVETDVIEYRQIVRARSHRLGNIQ